VKGGGKSGEQDMGENGAECEENEMRIAKEEE